MSYLKRLTSLSELKVENARVFVRAHLDLVIDRQGQVKDPEPVKRLVPTLRYLLDRGARVVVGARAGELKSGAGSVSGEKAPSLEAACACLAEHLGAEVFLPDGCTGDAVRKVLANLRENQLCVLENLAREDDMGSGAEAFARHLLDYTDIFVADSLRALEAESATTTILPRLVEQRAMGLALQNELTLLDRVARSVDEGRLLICGGGSFEDKEEIFHRYAQGKTQLALVGVAANTALAAENGQLGSSLLEESRFAAARFLRSRLKAALWLPTDLATGKNINDQTSDYCSALSVPAERMALDLGPQSRRSLVEKIGEASHCFLIGPCGHWPNPAFSAGTRAVLEALAASSGFTAVLGDDSVAAARALAPEMLGQIDYVSDGGKASLALLLDRKLPGLNAIQGN